MPRPPRADETGALYHALNQGADRRVLFEDSGDFAAFERIVAEGLRRYDLALYCYQLMPTHWHLVLSPRKNGELGRFIGWITATHTVRHRTRHLSRAGGLVYQGRYKSFPIENDEHFLTVCRYVEGNAVRANLVERAEEWRWSSLWRWTRANRSKLLSRWPIARRANWAEWVSAPLNERELSRIRNAAVRGTPYGDTDWTNLTARRLGIESTLHARGRPRSHVNQQ